MDDNVGSRESCSSPSDVACVLFFCFLRFLSLSKSPTVRAIFLFLFYQTSLSLSLSHQIILNPSLFHCHFAHFLLHRLNILGGPCY